MTLLDLSTFISHLHPLLVHLPIGFLLVAAILGFVLHRNPLPQSEKIISLTLFAGFLAALLSSISGYLLSGKGDYDANLVGNHQWAGISLTVLSGIIYLIHSGKLKRVRFSRNTFLACLTAMLALIAYTGHLGGNLTHGSDYLSMQVLMKKERKKPVSVEEAYLYEDVVAPILESKCAQCHKPGKRKGKLSVQSLADLLKGGKTGAAIVAGKPKESELVKRISLDPEHKDFMPKDGKTPLTKTETAIITWWIEKAMATAGKKIKDIDSSAMIQPRVASFLKLKGSQADNEEGSPIVEINPGIPVSADMKKIEALRSKGLAIRILHHKPMMLDIRIPPEEKIKIETISNDLVSIAPNIIWLNVSNNNLRNGDCGFLKPMKNIEKLRLEKNPIGDGISEYLSDMKHLHALNLNETKITDATIAELVKLPKLKNIYSWRTSVSK